jgi:hypothetical protein
MRELLSWSSSSAAERYSEGSDPKIPPAGSVGLYRELRWGPLRSIADVYLPFRLYKVEVHNGERRQVLWLTLDAVCGALDVYGLECEVDPSEVVER